MTKLKLKSDIFKSSNKSILKSFPISIKMSKNLSAKYFEEDKERLQKKASARYPNLSKEEKEKSERYKYGRDRYKNLSKDEKK